MGEQAGEKNLDCSVYHSFLFYFHLEVSFVKREEIFANMTDVFEYFQPNFQHLYFNINSYNCS